MNTWIPSSSNDLRTISEAQIIDHLLVGGWVYELGLGQNDIAVETTREALNRWVTMGLPQNITSDGKKYYDPVEVVNFMKHASLNLGDAYWVDHFVRTGQKMYLQQTATLESEEGNQETSSKREKDFEVTFCRVVNDRLAKLGHRFRMPVPLPIEDHNLAKLSIHLQQGATDKVELTRKPGRIEASFPPEFNRELNIAYCAKFRAVSGQNIGDSSALLSSKMNQIYTRKKEGLIHVSPKINALSRTLTEGSSAPQNSLNAIWDWVIDWVKIGKIHYHSIDPSDPLGSVIINGWCDCNLGSALFVSLCRAATIPARLVSGYVLYKKSPFYHFWAEAWIEDMGWVPYDLLGWDLSAGGKDKIWKNCFKGQLDFRMKTQVLPEIFTGKLDIKLPSAWHQICNITGDKIRTNYFDAKNGDLIFYDEIQVRALSG